jgi:hypothetical protein
MSDRSQRVTTISLFPEEVVGVSFTRPSLPVDLGGDLISATFQHTEVSLPVRDDFIRASSPL